MRARTCLTIVLAAGEGTRMRSSRPKVLHQVAARSLLAHVLTAVRGAGTEATAVVVGPNCEIVAEEARRVLPKAEVFVQRERRGTAHAVLAARAAIEKGADDIVVCFGDTPLISADTLRRLRAAIDQHASVAVLGFRPEDPTGYGRLITNGHRLVAIREERDASDIERDRPLQWRVDGTPWRCRARYPDPHRRQERQAGILPHGCRRNRGRDGA